MLQIRVYFPIQKLEVWAEKGSLLSDVIRSAGIPVDFPCGGHGKCGKCKVDIQKNGKKETVYACQYRIEDALEVQIHKNGQAQILTEDVSEKGDWNPYYPTDGVSGEHAVAAFDIGTTSLAGYLMSCRDGKILSVVSRFNPQRTYGADVISRAIYESEKRDGKLGKIIRNAIDEMLGELAEKAGMDRRRIVQVMLVGNTCMHHLFLGITTDSLLKVPYQAARKDAFKGQAEMFGLHIAPKAELRFLPNLAGFVGADTVGCLLAVNFLEEKKKTLMIDIGTNGELVMGTGEKAYTCSTAAGPALEGAKISCGMCGTEGAIQHVKAEKKELQISVIGDCEATGICGSGLIDAIAVFFREGMIEPRGRIRKAEKLETEFAKANAWRICREKGNTRIILTDQIAITQQDIREVQLAKSAIAAGIRILCRKLGWILEDLDQILVAGAFGNYMDKDSACDIGLLPKECRERIRGIGNAAGAGARLALSDKKYWMQAKQMEKHISFVELASEEDFQELFIKELEFR